MWGNTRFDGEVDAINSKHTGSARNCKTCDGTSDPAAGICGDAFFSSMFSSCAAPNEACGISRWKGARI